jgi:hypothetical protein
MTMKKILFAILVITSLVFVARSAHARIIIPASPEVDGHNETDHDHADEPTTTAPLPTITLEASPSRSSKRTYVPAPAPAPAYSYRSYPVYRYYYSRSWQTNPRSGSYGMYWR